MTKKKPKKPELREFWIVESEYGWDFKRWYSSVHKTEAIAKKYVAYLNEKDPHDKHYIRHVREVRK